MALSYKGYKRRAAAHSPRKGAGFTEPRETETGVLAGHSPARDADGVP